MKMSEKFQCPECGRYRLWKTTTFWQCSDCNSRFRCISGIPCFFREDELDPHDRTLRDRFYNGLMGVFYQFMMPLLVMPVRPLTISWKHWLIYFLVLSLLLQISSNLLIADTLLSITGLLQLLFVFILTALMFRHRYLFHLFILAVPVKLSLLRSTFVPEKTFSSIHQDLLQELKHHDGKLEILDISTGSCNSLIRHGWLDLDAHFTGLDLSEVMLKNGVRQITALNRAMDFVFAEASELPFSSNFFDVTLNYGAVNGYANIRRALDEMLRVTKKGGLILLFDENLYSHASGLEMRYFKKVLSSHDTVDHCPREFLPDGLKDLKIYQVYQFYYLLTAVKA